MELQEGNVLNCVCLSSCLSTRGVQPCPLTPPPRYQKWDRPPLIRPHLWTSEMGLVTLVLVTSGDRHWIAIQTFLLDYHPHLLPVLISGGLATKACTVGKRVVWIPLECILVGLLLSNIYIALKLRKK